MLPLVQRQWPASEKCCTAGEYAQDESRRAGLDITVTAVMPRMTPFGDVGRRGVRAYAARGGQTEEAYLKQMWKPLTSRWPGPPWWTGTGRPGDDCPRVPATAAGLQKLP